MFLSAYLYAIIISGMEFIISQVLGFIALILVCIGYFVKGRQTFLLIQIVANIFYSGAFLVQSSLVGGIITLISTLRCVYLLICEKKNFQKTLYFLPVFIVLYVVTTVLLFESISDIIPIITATMFTLAFYIKDLQTTRYICILPNLLLIFYNVLCLTFTSALLDFIEVVVLIIAIVKFSKQKRENTTKDFPYTKQEDTIEKTINKIEN